MPGPSGWRTGDSGYGGAMSRGGAGGTGGAHARRRAPGAAPRRMRVTGWLAISAASVLVLATLGLYFKIRSEWDTIGRVTVTSGELGKRPPRYDNALNILLIGSDSRAGRNARIGGYDQGQRSDTVMVVHLAPGRHRAIVMSIPRDTVVPVLACPASNGTTGQQAVPGAAERINATFSAGGPACLWKTVEQVTGIRIDHFAELNFVGFEKVIDSLGGVQVCLPVAVDDPMSGLDLTAGRHHIMGSQAIAFWRTREGLGLQDDPQRIQRDQFLMASLVQGIEHSDLLGSPARIFAVLSDIAGSLTIDEGLDQQAMLQIAESMRGISGKSVQFVTVPYQAYPSDPAAELQLRQPQAGQLFSAIAHDQTLPKARKKPSRPAGRRPPPAVRQVARTYGGISGDANVCKDQAAFAG
jgi:LCP family protein required for cell wall assembly